EEVRRFHAQRRLLRSRGTVDKRLIRLLLRIIGDRDALVAREWAQQDINADVLDQAPRLGQRFVGAGIGASKGDLDRMSGDRGPGHTVLRPGALGLAARLLNQRVFRTGERFLLEGLELPAAGRPGAELYFRAIGR